MVSDHIPVQDNEGSHAMNREQRLAEIFVELADTLVEEFDVIDLAHTLTDRSVELLDADAAGLMLTDRRGNLDVLASSTHQVRVLELFQLQREEGPCLDCFTTGHPVVNVERPEMERRWPHFTSELIDAGYTSVHAIPLRLRTDVIGAMNLFCAKRSTLGDQDIAVAQALSDVATIGLLQERTIRHREVLSEQLQYALNSRVLLEQAKGVLAERHLIGVDEGFDRLRDHARTNGMKLVTVARAVIDGSLDLSPDRTT